MHTSPPQSRVLVVVLVQSIHLLLSVVEVVEHDPDHATGNETGNSHTDEHPLDGRVVEHGVQGLGDGGTEGIGKEEHGLHERLHRWRGLGVCILVAGDGRKNLGDTNEHVRAGLGSNVDVVSSGLTVDDGSIAKRLIKARAGFVDEVLDDGCVSHGESSNPETDNNTGDRRERNASLAQSGHHKAFDNGKEDDDSNGIEVLHQVVRNAVSCHLAGLGDKVSRKLSVNDPVNRVETEDLASDERTLDLVNKAIVPFDLTGDTVVAHGELVGRLGGIHVAVLNHHPDGAEAVGNDRALRRTYDVDLATQNEDNSTEKEHAQAEKEGGPKSDIPLHIWRRDSGERAQVDTEIEYHVDPRDGDGRVDDDALARLRIGCDLHLATLVLIGNQRGDIRFDASCADTDDYNGRDETS